VAESSDITRVFVTQLPHASGGELLMQELEWICLCLLVWGSMGPSPYG